MTLPKPLRPATIAAIVLLAALGLTGCSPFSSWEEDRQMTADEPPTVEPVEQEPSDEEIEAATQAVAEPEPEPEPEPAWTCFSDVTLNDDWHDDVLCSRGAEAIRPYLREWDDFVTESEIMESAAEYEAELNAGP
ncbi:hypothetical protein [Agromyces sp. Marseille-Q5079]|uniref:hypothetical protein n=1 Tax=Agromyces sp. Marseille-Q5079 TaxID=3439059 RepID=UPI003D9C8147